MEHEWKTLKEQLKQSVLAGIDFSRENSEEELWEKIDEQIVLKAKECAITVEQRMKLRRELFSSLRQLDVLQELVDDPEVTEIMVNGKDHIFVERSGRLERWNRSFEQVEQLEDMIQQVVSRVNRTVNVSNPIADARLADGSRVHVVLPPVSLDGPVMTGPSTSNKRIAGTSA